MGSFLRSTVAHDGPSSGQETISCAFLWQQQLSSRVIVVYIFLIVFDDKIVNMNSFYLVYGSLIFRLDGATR